MKHLPYYLLLLLFLAACHKQEESPSSPVTALPTAWAGPQTDGWVKAKRDGQDWQGSIRGTIHEDDPTKISFEFNTFDADTVVIEALDFISIPLKVGKYFVTKNRPLEHSIYWVGYFDETDAWYEVIEDMQNCLWIDSYDPITKVVAGRFQSFYTKTRNILFNYPSTVSFTDGEFSVKLY